MKNTKKITVTSRSVQRSIQKGLDITLWELAVGIPSLIDVQLRKSHPASKCARSLRRLRKMVMESYADFERELEQLGGIHFREENDGVLF